LEVRHLSARLLHCAALTLLVDPLRLSSFGRPCRLALSRSNVGSRDHFRQPAPGIGTVGLLRTKAARGDEQLARASYTASGNRLQALVRVGMQTEPEQVDAQLHGGRNLVDVLTARA